MFSLHCTFTLTPASLPLEGITLLSITWANGFEPNGSQVPSFLLELYLVPSQTILHTAVTLTFRKHNLEWCLCSQQNLGPQVGGALLTYLGLKCFIDLTLLMLDSLPLSFTAFSHDSPLCSCTPQANQITLPCLCSSLFFSFNLEFPSWKPCLTVSYPIWSLPWSFISLQHGVIPPSSAGNS